MNIAKAYYYGFKETTRLPRPVILIYFTNLLLALIVVLPLWSLLDIELGNTISIKENLQEFRATVASDFIAGNTGGLKVILSQIWLIMFIYWLVSIFISGGIIQTLNQDKFTMTSFFSGSGYNFFRFSGIATVMLLLQVLLAVVIYLPVLFLLNYLSGTQSENVLVNIFFGAITIHGLLAIILIMVSDISKFYSFLYDSKNFIKSIKEGFKYVFRNFFKLFGLYLLLMVIPVLALATYLALDSLIGTDTAFGVFLVFLFGQIFIILRIWFRIWIYASPLQLYTDYFLKQDDVKAKIKMIENWNNKAKQQIEEDKVLNMKRIKEAKFNAIPDKKNLSEDEIIKIINSEKKESEETTKNIKKEDVKEIKQDSQKENKKEKINAKRTNEEVSKVIDKLKIKG